MTVSIPLASFLTRKMTVNTSWSREGLGGAISPAHIAAVLKGRRDSKTFERNWLHSGKSCGDDSRFGSVCARSVGCNCLKKTEVMFSPAVALVALFASVCRLLLVTRLLPFPPFLCSRASCRCLHDKVGIPEAGALLYLASADGGPGDLASDTTVCPRREFAWNPRFLSPESGKRSRWAEQG